MQVFGCETKAPRPPSPASEAPDLAPAAARYGGESFEALATLLLPANQESQMKPKTGCRAKVGLFHCRRASRKIGTGLGRARQ